MRKCPNCGNTNNDFNSFCEWCGAQIPEGNSEYFEGSNENFDSNPSANMNVNPSMNTNYSSSYNSNSGRNTHYTADSDKAGTQALIFGLLSIFCCSIVFGPLAIIKGNESNSSMGNAGKILGIIGLALWAISFVIGIIK
ncbi:hypothetical protein A7W90_14865 [Clostridium sp. Bc-iso-3]|nr:hypothetical protein A7W90_14865 [Clostridium sp. Bc-iso-3]